MLTGPFFSQVRTGEGKTAVLGVASCVFALFKVCCVFDCLPSYFLTLYQIFQVRVSCACYSEYLSTRDYSSLEFLFKALDVQAYISYCTLVKLCEDEINKKVNIREKVAAIISGSGSAAGDGRSSDTVGACPRVLLVDEVDVFFTQDFYGSFYNPACDLRHEKISELIQKIWDFGSSSALTTDIVKGWSVYSELCSTFPSWTFLIDYSITQMIQDLSAFSEHKYEVIDGKIGYREQDGIAFNVSEGYLTIFAHIKENKAGHVSETEMKKNLKLLVQCGHFLFAKLPTKFNLVLGVTGTLETLTKTEKDIVCKDYQIKRFVIMPSVYGINAVKMLGISTTSSETDFRQRLIEEIEVYSVQKARAVIAFFESKDSLMSFWRSDGFKACSDSGRVHVLLEEMRADEKQQIVSCRSGAAGAVTLATRPFGRGTDFAAIDESVNKAGGIHVVSSFLADTQSEEIQIKGRTARQGEQGSFSMILLRASLEKFEVQEPDIEQIERSAAAREAIDQQLWNLLNDKRRALCEAECAKLVNFVTTNEREHEEAWAFTDALLQGDSGRIAAFLKKQNQPPPAQHAHGKARILVLMDATGSMGNAMRAAKDTIGVMFDRATAVLADFGGGGSDLFEMQFAVYRNYSSGAEHLLEASEWRSNPQDLKDFLGRVRESGGQGNEAVEIGLWHANSQADLKQVQNCTLN